MAEEQDLERRAVEELLREAARARVRAETMGPAGWVKCPLRSTNKRFLLNTLRTSALPQSSAHKGSSQPERRSRDARRTSDPRSRGAHRTHRGEDARSRSPAKYRSPSWTLTRKSTQSHSHHNDRGTNNRADKQMDKCTSAGLSPKMTETQKPAGDDK
ncbi:hypothetical protein GJAV_G00069450 [Gymnothorax javanicus]|nr:hypothetical protein GJAV_G00069450 [Gymnothorax javanicus]